MDELSLLGLDLDRLNSDHLRLIDKADLITVSSDRLMKKLPEICHKKTILINNATSNEFIRMVSQAQEIKGKEGVRKSGILGYYGAIAEWMDFDLIEKLAARFSDKRLILIGPISHEVSDRLASILWRHPNVTIMPPVPHQDLPSLLISFEICLIPFIKNQVTDAISPVKLFEYFSSARPVVSTNIEECQKYPTVKVAETHEDFINQCSFILSNNLTSDDVSIEIAQKNTWEQRVNEIINYINNNE